MRKFYSLVLMAAALLIGTNVSAQVATISIDGGAAQNIADASALLSAIQGIQGEHSAVITMLDDATLGSADVDITLDGGTSVEIDLNNHRIDSYAKFLLKKASLSIVNNASAPDEDAAVYNMVRACQFASVYGSKQKDEPYGYSYLKVGANVTINSANQYGLAIFPRDYLDATYTGTATKDNGQIEQTDWKVKYGAGAGATIDIYGKITSKYGVSTNGQLAARTGNVPVINVYSSAEINTSEYNGIYAAGYAIWNIEGTVIGLTGLYAKAGVINLDGATITGTGAYVKPTENNNGTSGGGSGIVFDGNENYAGHMELHVEDTDPNNVTTVTSTNGGAAVEELGTTDPNYSATDSLEIKSGTFNGSVNMGSLNLSAELGENVQINGTITGGTYSSDVTVYMGGVSGALQPVVDPVTQQTVYKVVEGCVAKLNDKGLATFSSPDFDVVLPAGLTAWKATGLSGNELTLVQVAEAGDVLPEDAGLILSGTAGAYNLYKADDNDDAVSVSGNKLLPSTEWTAAKAGTAYILHGDELWIYDGTEFKDGKAFLPIEAVQGAPQRIRMVFNQATAIENVEVEAAKAEKFYENGQLFIRRGAEVYNVQGQLVK